MGTGTECAVLSPRVTSYVSSVITTTWDKAVFIPSHFMAEGTEDTWSLTLGKAELRARPANVQIGNSSPLLYSGSKNDHRFSALQGHLLRPLWEVWNICLLLSVYSRAWVVSLKATEQKDLFGQVPFAAPLRALALTEPSGLTPLLEPAESFLQCVTGSFQV